MNDWKGYGNISQPPEHGQTNNGTAYCNFSVGCREIDKKKNYNDKSTFVDCVVYGSRAEYMKEAGQGDEILIARSSIQVQAWKSKDTQKYQKKYRILVDRFIIPKIKGTPPGMDEDEVEDYRSQSRFNEESHNQRVEDVMENVFGD